MDALLVAVRIKYIVDRVLKTYLLFEDEQFLDCDIGWL